MPPINRRLAARRQVPLPPETLQRQAEVKRELLEVYERYADVPGEPMRTSIRFPLGLVLLLAGLWMLAGDEKRGVTEPEAEGERLGPEP